MLGYDISWAAFNIIEVMSASKFTFKVSTWDARQAGVQWEVLQHGAILEDVLWPVVLLLKGDSMLSQDLSLRLPASG